MQTAKLSKLMILSAVAMALSLTPASMAYADNKDKKEEREDEEKEDAIKGAVIGAGVGALVGGTEGAVVGGVAGAIIGKNRK